MVKRGEVLFIVVVVLFIVSLSIISAENCYLHDGDYSSCTAASCFWQNNSGAIPIDPWCWINYTTYGSTGACGPYSSCILQTGGLLINAGCCMENMGEGDGGSFSSCYIRSGTNQSYCQNMSGCTWTDNQYNQAANCYDPIGCCQQQGCLTFDGNEGGCNTTMKAFCYWQNKTQDPYCPDASGCCYSKPCSDVVGESNCTQMAMYSPSCFWNSTSEACEFSGGGGFSGFGSSDPCMQSGGWWDPDNSICNMPEGDYGMGAGGFMFAGEAHCWFADGQPNICRNITGCVYCNDTNNHISADNNSGTGNASSACYNVQAGYCQGHQANSTNFDGTNTFWYSDIAIDNLNCTHIRIKSACEFGPLPFCQWSNSSANVDNFNGGYCQPGVKTEKNAPPVPFCEHPDAKNNYTLCTQLSQNYMMPCKWGNASSNKTFSDNCTFNQNAIFGGEAVGKEYEIITSEMSCVAAGGTWNTEYYLDGTALKQDSWCEKGAMYSYDLGQAASNKGNCNSDCWACEFNSTGGVWSSVATAEGNCTTSTLGYCRWTNDSNAPNGLGWCNYPKEMDYGSSNCQAVCKDCDLMTDAYNACLGSAKGCNWVNNTNSTGSILSTGTCVDNTKKICENDCYSCYDFASCNTSATNCQWDNNNLFCKPASAAQNMEICFDGVDNEGDGMTDCADPDCSFDTACGGDAFGDCGRYTTNSTCSDGIIFGDGSDDSENCTWYNDSWETVGHCGMPGEDCWKYDYDLELCGLIPGCTNDSTMSFSDFCDANMTRMNDMNCEQYTTQETCNSATGSNDCGHQAYNATTNCTWVTSEWGEPHCEYWLWHECNGYGTNQSGCNNNSNCTWNTMDSRCEIACFNQSADQTACEAVPRGICEWRDADGAMCVSSRFQMMGGSEGGKVGCAQYNGNETGCIQNNFTCVWYNDTTVDNNITGDSDGWCDSKGEYELSGEMKGNIIMLGSDDADASVNDTVDIKGFGMRVTNEAYGFGIGVYNINDSVLCNGYPLNSEIGSGNGIGNKTSEFYWYLDTDGLSASTNNCNATGGATNYSGFEFYIQYVVKNSTESGKVETKKNLYRCIQNSTGGYVWAVTNVFVSDNKKFTCFESGGAGFVTIEKTGFENFDNFNITSSIRVFGTTAGDAYTASTRTKPADTVGPVYYTPGTVDFDFVDCSNPDVKDPKCKNFQKFGFQMFENCKNGVDDDADGYTDCTDAECSFSPVCATTAFNFIVNVNDNKAPGITFSNVEKMDDSATVMFDTDEIANGTLTFYNQSSSCTLGAGNATLDDLGDPVLSFDDYKPFHRVTIDSDTVGASLVNYTTYFYKVTVCDPSSNCGTSKCLNFTTKKAKKNFIFKMDVPSGYTVDIPALNYSGNFSTTVGTKKYEIGIKTNTSVSTKMNVTVNYSDLSLKFVGVDLYKPKTLSLTNAFIADTDDEVLGMNSSSKSWNMLLSDMGLGGNNDYLELEFPVAYSADNTLKWYADDLTNESDVSSYTNCTGDGTKTLCKIPTSIGFSVYQLSAPSAAAVATSPGSSGGGASLSWEKTFSISENQFNEGYIENLRKNYRIVFRINDEEHYVGVIKVDETTVNIRVASTPQEATLQIGDIRKFEITGDDFYDVSVKLNSIAEGIVGVTVKSIYEEVTSASEAEQEEMEEKAREKFTPEVGGLPTWVWVIISVVVLLVIIFIALKVMKKKRR